MKARNFFHILGFRAKPRHYHYKKSEHPLDVGTVKYYRWQHPREKQKSIPQALVDEYRTLIDEGDFCVDIGAHTGDATLPIAIAAGRKGKVLALEPNPYVYHVLEKNVRANRELTNITSILGAATAEETFMEFEYSDSGFCNGGRHENIPILKHGHAYKQEVFGVNLEKELTDDFSEWLPKLKFIKIDAEGYDLYILKSLSDLIEKYRPIVKAEVFTNTSIDYRSGMLSFFTDRNYQLFKIEKDPLEKGPAITSENVDEWRRYDVIGHPL
jgi:FkbM family methyltransferase